MRVSGEEGQGIGGTGRQDNVKGIAGGDLVHKFRCVEHGAGPWLDDGEFDGVGLGVVGNLRAAACDFSIERGDAQAQMLGFGAANTIVLRC